MNCGKEPGEASKRMSCPSGIVRLRRRDVYFRSNFTMLLDVSQEISGCQLDGKLQQRSRD